MNVQIKPKPVAQRAIKVSRTFVAPRELVFGMFTEPKHLAVWWGPHGFTNPVCEVEARPGGKMRISMQAPDGNQHPFMGLFHEVVPHDRLVFSTFVDTPDGQRVLEGYNVVTFAEQGGRTTVTVEARAEGYVDFAERMLSGMEAGWSQSLDKLAAHAAHETNAADADDQTAIRAIFGDRTNALFGKVVDLAVKHLADDIVSYNLDPPLQHLGPCREALQKWFETWDGPIAVAMAELNVETGGDLALVHGLAHMTGAKTDGAKADMWFRYTAGLRRSGGTWKITHQHSSVPFYMDSGFKAAVDLKP
jgi:PhnB protein